MTEKERRFVEAYMGQCAGNATSAAIAAGYAEKSAQVTGSRLLRKAMVQAAIAARQAKDPLVATREELQAFWSATMRSPEMSMRDRLKASELNARSNGLFIDRTKHEGTVTVDLSGASERLAGRLADIAARLARGVPEKPER